MNPAFLNLNGYSIRKIGNVSYCWLLRKAVYEFTANHEWPITFRRGNGDYVQTDRHFQTDMGSIPRFGQLLIPKDSYLEPFIFHDCAFLHHGLWFKGPDDLCFSFRRMHMGEANALLREMMQAQGAWNITASTVYAAVQTFGAGPWGNIERRMMAGSQDEE